jgi:hypothetical protein
MKKPNPASLIGGIAVAAASFALWVAIAQDLSVASIRCVLAGLLVATGIGVWIRAADL